MNPDENHREIRFMNTNIAEKWSAKDTVQLRRGNDSLMFFKLYDMKSCISILRFNEEC